MIYVPIDARNPIAVKKEITVQRGVTNNFPQIVFELHDGCKYLDLGDNCTLSAAITKPHYDETVKFTGGLSIMNPHRGQILCSPSYSDFTEYGLNTLTVRCSCGDFDISFQTTIFVQSLADDVIECLGKE